MFPRMKTAVFASVLLAAIVGVAMPQVVKHEKTKEATPGVLFAGTSLPSPPQQGQSWNPPSSRLPEKWGTAVAELRRQGLADPRGCEYREVKITCGGIGNNKGFLVATHAWVIPSPKLPESKEGEQRFAIAWNGLIYTAIEIGKPADFMADMEVMIRQDDELWKRTLAGHEHQIKQAPEVAAFPPQRSVHVYPEVLHAGHEQLQPLKIAMVFLLGEGELASRAWTAWSRGVSRPDNPAAPGGDPYLLLAQEFAWAHYDRAIGAHLRGDDVISMHTLEKLLALQATVETVAKNRGIPRPRNRVGADDESRIYLNYHESPERLLEDEVRRVKAGPIPRALDVGLDRFPDQKSRVAALIRDLEVVDATQGGQPGSVQLSDSPIVKALIAEGQPAIEPLLDCLEKDKRLTRSVGYGRDFRPERYFVTVDEAAAETLYGILKTRHFGPKTEYRYYHVFSPLPSMETRRAVAAEIRDYWQKHKGQTETEIWFATLVDSNATTRQWLEAAAKIVRPVRLKSKDSTGRQPPPLAGEPLRSKTDPSVADLLARRADEIAARAQRDFDVRDACDMTLHLARWDVRAALPVVRRRLDECWPLVKQAGSIDRLAVPFANLVEAAMQAGDDAAVDQYVAWFHGVPPKDFPSSSSLIFRPLWRHPDNPKIAELSRWMFLADNSPWHPPHGQESLLWHRLLTSPLLGVPAFREMLKTQLANKSPIGQYLFYDRQGGGTMDVSSSGFRSGFSLGSYYTVDGELPALKQKHPLRTCDFYATRIFFRAEGAPRFELYWPEKRRDAVLKESAAFLDRWGDCFRDMKKSLDYYYDFATPRFHLTRLSRPATHDDVAAGRAIFSLLGPLGGSLPSRKAKSEHNVAQKPAAERYAVRVVELKPYPSVARWKTLKQFPLQRPQLLGWTPECDPEKLSKLPTESFDREGLIWQAEEILVDGLWRRYYGFVGNHIIAKVPAEEIEIIERFGASFPWRDR